MPSSSKSHRPARSTLVTHEACGRHIVELGRVPYEEVTWGLSCAGMSLYP